jgi:hypothetical protein
MPQEILADRAKQVMTGVPAIVMGPEMLIDPPGRCEYFQFIIKENILVIKKNIYLVVTGGFLSQIR